MNEIEWTMAEQNRLYSTFVSNELDGFCGSITVYKHGQCGWRVMERGVNGTEFVFAVGEAENVEAAKAEIVRVLAELEGGQ